MRCDPALSWASAAPAMVTAPGPALTRFIRPIIINEVPRSRAALIIDSLYPNNQAAIFRNRIGTAFAAGTLLRFA